MESATKLVGLVICTAQRQRRAAVATADMGLHNAAAIRLW